MGRLLATTVVALALATLSCSGDGLVGPAPVPSTATVRLSGAPADSIVLVGESTPLTATVTDATGAAITTATVSWQSSAPAVASVSATGVVSALAPGGAVITASALGSSASAPLSVRVPVAVSASAPTTATVLSGNVGLTIPAGAVPAGVPKLTVGPSTVIPQDDRLVAGAAYEFGPSGTRFNSPITITLRYNATGLSTADRSELRVFLFEPSGLQEIENSVPSTTDNVVTAQVTHFSRYVVLRRAVPTQMAVGAGNAQSGNALTTLPVAPSVVVRDASGRPVPRVPVLFRVGTGGGVLRGDSIVFTTGLGTATLPGGWTLGPAAGANTLVATSQQGTIPPVTFTATASAAPAPTIALSAGSLAFSARAATGNPAAQSVAVTNGAIGTPALTGLSVGTPTYTAGTPGWLSASLSSAAAPATLTIRAATGGLTAGSYAALLPVASSMPGVPPVNVTVTFVVSPSLATRIAVTSEPAGAGNGAPFTTQPVVEFRDANGDRVAGATAPVTAFIVSGSGRLQGTTSVFAVNGIARFTDLQITGSGAHTIAFETPGLPEIRSAVFTVGPLASALRIATQPAGVVSGARFVTQPVVHLLDAAGTLVSSGLGTSFAVTASIASGTGTLSGTTTVVGVNGVATFTDLVLTGTGPHTIRFAATALALTTTSGAITPVLGTAALLVITTQPSAVVSGVTMASPPVVEVRDGTGSRVAEPTVVTVSVAEGIGALSGTTTATTVNGIATFTGLRLAGTASHRLRFAAAGAPSVLSNDFTVTQAVAALRINGVPASSYSSVPFASTITVDVTDNAGLTMVPTVAVTVSLASGSGALIGSVTASAVSGRATFTGLGITGTGPHVLRFATVNPAVSVLSAAIDMQPPPIGTITANSVTTQSAVVGTAVAAPPSVRVTNPAGGPAVDIPVTFSVTAGGGAIAPTAPAVVNTDASGIATLTSWTVGTVVGANRVTAAAAGVAGSPITFVSTAGPAAASTIVAGSAVSQSGTVGTAVGAPPSVRVTDSFGNGVSGVVVSFAVTTGGGNIAPATVTTNANGVATATSWTLGLTPGANSATASAAGLTGSPLSFAATASAGAASQVVLTTQPAGAVSGVVLTTQPVMEIRDAAGNVITGSTASVTASLASGTGSLLGTTTVSAVNGVATFASLKINGSGAHTLRFAVSGLTSATSASLTVTQVAASLSVQTQPSGAASGAAFTTQPVVRILDNAGLVVTTGAGATLSVTAAVASGTGTLGGTATVTAVNGVASFTNLALTGAGAHTLAFSTSSPALSVTSSSFGMAAGAAAQLAITTQPAGAVSGVNLTTQPVVEIRDAAGNVVTGSTASVTAAIASGTGTLVGTVTVSAVNGVATFSTLRVNGSGAHTITFTASALTSATSASFTATQVAASLSVQTQPAGATTGSAFTTQPVVRILDNAGLVVTTGAGASLVVTASKASGSGTLGGTATATAVNGVATFADLVITGLGAHTLQFATTSPALTATSTSVTVAAAPATQLGISTQPAGAVSGVVLTTQPVVQIRDANGNVVTGSTASVTAAIASGTGTLVGTATVSAVNGVATFSNLQINGSGAHTLTFTASGLTSATSASFTATQVAASLSVQTQPAGATTGSAFTTQPVVRILDNAGLVVTTGAGASLVVTASKASGSGTLGGTATATAVNGVATFAGLAITGTGAHTLQFATTSPALTVTSASVTVAALPGVYLNVGATPTTTAIVSTNITVPLSVDLSNRGSLDVASLTVTITWDPAKFSYVSNAAGTWTDDSGGAASVTVNATNTASGTLSLSGFTSDATTSSFTLRSITLRPLVSGSAAVSASVSAAGNVGGTSITVTPRNLAVTINP